MDRHHVQRFGYETTGMERIRKALTLGKKDVVEFANRYLGEDRLVIVVR